MKVRRFSRTSLERRSSFFGGGWPAASSLALGGGFCGSGKSSNGSQQQPTACEVAIVGSLVAMAHLSGRAGFNFVVCQTVSSPEMETKASATNHTQNLAQAFLPRPASEWQLISLHGMSIHAQDICFHRLVSARQASKRKSERRDPSSHMGGDQLSHARRHACAMETRGKDLLLIF